MPTPNQPQNNNNHSTVPGRKRRRIRRFNKRTHRWDWIWINN
ncbi:MAG: hypothetical protein QM673_05425 [Gordonia sp. (in: high G+C Gram-positive bacteria)]